MTPTKIKFPPYQGHTVKVSVINAAKSSMRAALLVTPAPSDRDHLKLAGYSFLIESQHRNHKVLFDLAFMKDVKDRAPPALKPFLNNKEVINIEESQQVSTVLTDHGIDLSNIDSIVWSHAHIDHTGEPSVFPPTTELVVGPSFKKACMPGFPTNPQSPVLDSAFQGRRVREVDFAKSISIGGFRAIDFFSDGSFWLLETLGHTEHHLSALCRTTEDSYVFMGGDICHSIAQLRPSSFRPLPASVPASVLGKTPPLKNFDCACLRQLQRNESCAFYGLAPGMQEDLSKAQETIEKLKAFDGRDDVLIVIAHDATLLDVMEFFPKDMNDWKGKDWADRGRWQFLKDFEKAA
jgi:glyoxylase-like metal-dependent hydrolase (beta-lactamase superfamily II)